MDEPMGTKEAARYVSAALEKRGKRLSAATVKNYVDHGHIPAKLIGRARVKPGPKPGSHHKRKGE